MDRPTQLLDVGLGVRGGGESELVMVEWVKGRGVPMSRLSLPRDAGLNTRV